MVELTRHYLVLKRSFLLTKDVKIFVLTDRCLRFYTIIPPLPCSFQPPLLINCSKIFQLWFLIYCGYAKMLWWSCYWWRFYKKYSNLNTLIKVTIKWFICSNNFEFIWSLLWKNKLLENVVFAKVTNLCLLRLYHLQQVKSVFSTLSNIYDGTLTHDIRTFFTQN